jgi:dienelactone hydrolase
MGTSRGGEAALLVASHYRQLRAVVSYSGSGLVFPAPADPTQAAWTWHGRGVAWARSAATVRQAEIPVERINGPVLLICGKDDRLWPSGTLLQVAVRRLQAHGRPYRYLCYPSAGHLIQPPYLPTQSTIDSRFGGDPKGQEAADTDSWSRVLALLRSAL